ncbi:pq loop repeat protein [Anaeramoeba flamelloides]|uniref:Pq loop repeat protein n=1 Tax=Anaeramoeba flamelloides TaxID=1746091 RepID=A0AAV7YD42_9EUKA|nr:pq loop repeat protein [Anaeramoeba flamelloides]KAJ6237003.1 pq loop repeat protein [Anaeramoeba flamelloides]
MSDQCPSDFLSPDLHHEYQLALVNMNDLGIITGIVIGLGSVLSYLPQVLKLFKRRSVLGINFIFIFFCTLNQFYAAANAVILNLPKTMACAQVGFGKCYSSLLAMLQITGLWVMFFPVPLLFILFHNNYESIKTQRQSKREQKKYKLYAFLYVLVVLDVVVVALITIISVAIQGPCSVIARTLAQILGVVSGIIVLFQWIPQIYSTYKFKGAGSVSVITLAVQAPGGFINLAFMIFISKEKFSTWFSFFVNTIQVIILLTMIIYYHLKSKIKKKNKKKDSIDLTENEPLISNKNINNNDDSSKNQKYI